MNSTDLIFLMNSNLADNNISEVELFILEKDISVRLFTSVFELYVKQYRIFNRTFCHNLKLLKRLRYSMSHLMFS